ncbi:MAG TPA: polysaccharide lyase family protein [Edaphobacter sp.]|nr:polysaccharide lyase family protein [Edaphobacter sp.]
MVVKSVAIFATELLLLILSGSCLPLAHSQEQESTRVFQIGTFDRSSGEFAEGTPKAPVTFAVGTSQTKEWFAAQLAELDTGESHAASKQAANARNITFRLSGAPAKEYSLHVAVLIETPSVPALQIGVNGKAGRFYLDPKLDFKNGDVWDSFDPIYSHADVVVTFPGTYLHEGINTITLDAIEEASEAAPDAGITYDAIELTTGSKSAHPQAYALIKPTIFYQDHKGSLEELVDVYLDHASGVRKDDHVTLSIGGETYRQALHSNRDFGQERVEFPVKEFPGNSVAKVDWVIAGGGNHAQQTVDPAKKWELYLVPHIHLDIGYSDYQAKVAAIQSRVIDEALDFTKQNPDFRFSLDGQWSLEQFMKTRPPADQERAIGAIRSRKLFAPAQYAQLLTGVASGETLIRSLYAGANLSRLHGTPFDYANLTDVPSFSGSYASILAAAGIKDFLSASNNYRAPVLLKGHLNENSPVWLEGPDGGRVRLWSSRHYEQMQFLFGVGVPPVVAAGRDTIPLFLEMFRRPGYKSNRVIVFGSQAENTDLFPQQASLAEKWNEKFAYPHLRYAGTQEALRAVGDQFGNDLPVIRGDGGPYWEDGLAADAYFTAMGRNNEVRALSAEKLETIASLVKPGIAADKEDLDQLWKNIILTDEHTCTSFNSDSEPTSEEAESQSAAKRWYAVQAQGIADRLSRGSMANIADSISVDKGALVVFNTLNWQRSGFVTVDLHEGDEILDASTNTSVRTESVSQGHHFRRVRFRAQNVPAVGYKVFLERQADKAQAAAEASMDTSVLENRFYRIQLDPASGALLSIYDKDLQREVVNTRSPYRFGQYLYVTGGDASSSSILHYRQGSPRTNLDTHPATQGRLISVIRTPYGWDAHMRSTATNTPQIDTEIQLFDDEKKIELIEEVTKTETYAKEAAYFAFPLAMDHPEFRYEIQNGTIDPAKDMYPGAGHEWFSVQHWVAAQQDGLSAAVFPLDASLVTLGDINRGSWPTDFGSRSGTIFSYVMDNYWDTNYRAAQGGEFRFRYIISTSPATVASHLSRMGWEEATPLERDEVTSQDKAIPSGGLSAKTLSFLQVDDPDLLLQTWKPAEGGTGTILRFVDLGGTERKIHIRTPLLRVQEAWKTDAVERDLLRLEPSATDEIELTIHPHEIATIRLEGQHAPQATH